MRELTLSLFLFLLTTAAVSQVPSAPIRLHCNKAFYQPQDTVYFKLYPLPTATAEHEPSSQLIHVELFSGQGKLLQKQQLYAEAGHVNSFFAINSPADTALYYLRAYTQLQKTNADTILLVEPIIVCAPPFHFVEKPSIKLHFSPHSTDVVEGLPAMIDVYATNDFGHLFTGKGYIADHEGNKVANFDTGNPTMGQFLFVPVANKTYTATVVVHDKIVTQPFISVQKQGASLYAPNVTADTVSFRFYSNFKSPKKTITVLHDKQILWAAEDTTNRNVLRFSIPQNVFPPGRSQVVVATDSGRVLSRYWFEQSKNGRCTSSYDAEQERIVITTNTPTHLSLSLSDTVVRQRTTIRYAPDAAQSRSENEPGIDVRGTATQEQGKPYANGDLMVFNAVTKRNFIIKTNENAAFSFVDELTEDTLVYFVQGLNRNGKPVKVTVRLKADSIPFRIPSNPYSFARKTRFSTSGSKPVNQGAEVKGEKVIDLSSVEVKAKASSKYLDNKSKLFKADVTINQEEIKQRVGSRAATNLEELLIGRVPGLELVGGRIRIRGPQSFGSNTPLLILVDNAPADYLFVEELMRNWQLIEKIEIVKSLSGSILYGSRGGGGIVAITTKNLLKATKTPPSQFSLGTILKVGGLTPSLGQKNVDRWYVFVESDGINPVFIPLKKSDLQSSRYLQIEGISQDGLIVSFQQRLEIK
ncbi:MAG: hypothetical protein EAZ91_02565 [Cytophagales bacterium]|nr:MAG: hypothetical protein EAZ91_02565 [Cytophagales bacterium]